MLSSLLLLLLLLLSICPPLLALGPLGLVLGLRAAIIAALNMNPKTGSGKTHTVSGLCARFPKDLFHGIGLAERAGVVVTTVGGVGATHANTNTASAAAAAANVTNTTSSGESLVRVEVTAVELLGKDCRDLLTPSEVGVVTNNPAAAAAAGVTDIGVTPAGTLDDVVVGNEKGGNRAHQKGGNDDDGTADGNGDSEEKQVHRKVSTLQQPIRRGGGCGGVGVAGLVVLVVVCDFGGGR
jgi:hypothetical protein